MERCSRMVLCRTCHAFSLQKRDLMLNITLENPRMKLVDKIVFTTRDTVDCMTQASHHVRYLLCFVSAGKSGMPTYIPWIQILKMAQMCQPLYRWLR